MKTKVTLLFSILLSISSIQAQEYYAVHSPDGNSLFATFDISTGVESSSVIVSIDGNQVDGCTGMARNPLTGEIYVVAKLGPVFTLGTINASTGVVSGIGTLSEKFSGITFNSQGTLYGITGDGADTPETLYTINILTADITLLLTPGGFGGDGEAIGFNSNNGLLYRFGGDRLFQSIDPVTLEVVEIGFGIDVANWAHSLTYIPDTDNFLFTAADDVFFLTTSGSLTVESTLVQGATGGYKGTVKTLPSGLENGVDELVFEVFPNPAADMLVLNLVNSTAHLISIYSVKGELIDQWSVNGKTTIDYDVSSLSNGTYLITLDNGKNTRQKSFVVSK